jgi:hypothetical protein
MRQGTCHGARRHGGARRASRSCPSTPAVRPPTPRPPPPPPPQWRRRRLCQGAEARGLGRGRGRGTALNTLPAGALAPPRRSMPTPIRGFRKRRRGCRVHTATGLRRAASSCDRGSAEAGGHAEGKLVGEEAEERVGLREEEMERLPLHRRYSVPFRSHRAATLVACAAEGLIQFCVFSRPRAELEKMQILLSSSQLILCPTIHGLHGT